MPKKKGPGQPPKPDSEKKSVQKNVSFTQSQSELVEKARKKECPEKLSSAYIRDIVVDHAECVVKKK